MRSWMVPGAALALAGSVVLTPVMATSPVAAPTVPSVHIDDVQLAGIGQNIYYAITPTVQYVVGGGSYIVNFIPIIGGAIAAQININYFQGIQPVVEATVNALAGVVQDPLNFLSTISAYGTTLYDIGYNWVSAELQWLGLPGLPLLPPLASVRGSSTPTVALRAAAAPRAAAVVAAADSPAASPGARRGDLRRPAGAAAVAPRAAAKALAAHPNRAAAVKAAGHARAAAKVATG